LAASSKTLVSEPHSSECSGGCASASACSADAGDLSESRHCHDPPGAPRFLGEHRTTEFGGGDEKQIALQRSRLAAFFAFTSKIGNTL
jgi:hypothetical protein